MSGVQNHIDRCTRPLLSARATAIIQAKVDPLHHLQRRWEHFVLPWTTFQPRESGDVVLLTTVMYSTAPHRPPRTELPSATFCLLGLSLMLRGG